MGGASSGGGGAGGSCSVTSGSVHNQPVLVHSRGHPGTPNAAGGAGGVCGGSESDCRTTPIDSDLESAKSANLVMSGFPYSHHHSAYHQHSSHHHTLSPGQQRGTASPSVGSNERHLSIGHAGLIGE